MFLSRRSASRVRGHAPACLLALSVLSGQAIAWFLSIYQLLGLSAVLIAACFLNRGSYLFLGTLVGLFSALGALLMQVPVELTQDGSFLVEVTESPRRPKTGEVVFVARNLLSSPSALMRCSAVELPWRHAAGLSKGSVIWIRGQVKPVERSINPFSWQAAMWRRGISADCRARYVSAELSKSPTGFESVRDLISSGVQSALGERRGAALFLSMAFGFRDLLSNPVERAFTSLGLKHLLVVSGYQVSLFFAFVAWICGAIASRASTARHVRSASMCVAFAFTLAFLGCIGSELSAVRAVIAAASICCTSAFERAGRFAQRWGVALLFILLLSPWAFFDVGVQLTFAALLGIGVGARLGQGSMICSFLCVSLCAWLFTGGVVLGHGGTLSLVGLPLNILLAAPWSFINCVVGSLGLFVLLLSGGRCSWVIRAVAQTNEIITSELIRIAESPLGAVTLQWSESPYACSVLGVLVALLLYRASQKQVELIRFSGK